MRDVGGVDGPREFSDPRGTGDAALAREIEAKLDGRVRPVLQAHGGDLTLLAVSDGVVGVRFEGACVGCPLRPVTMAVTIGPALRPILGVRAVRAEGVRLSQASAARLAATVVKSETRGGGTDG